MQSDDTPAGADSSVAPMQAAQPEPAQAEQAAQTPAAESAAPEISILAPESPSEPAAPVETPAPAAEPPAEVSAHGEPTLLPDTSLPSPEPHEQPPAENAAPPAAPAVERPRANPRSFLAKALAVIQSRKRKKLDKIVQFAALKRSVSNKQVEKLLRVSDATATRYLAQLVKEGRLRKLGPDGHARYEPQGGSIPTN